MSYSLELNLFAVPGTEGKFSFLHLFVAPFSDIFFASSCRIGRFVSGAFQGRRGWKYKVLTKNIQTLQEKASDIQKATESILKITKKIMGEKGFSACKIIPYIDKTPISLPRLCSDRHSLIDELETLLKTYKALILYAGVKEGKTVASRLLARRLKNDYQIIEIDLAYSNELNLEYIINSYDSSNKYLFILDGVLYDSEQYEAFSDLISRLANEDRLFVINCYDKISDYIFDDTLHIEEKELPPLSLEEVMNMMPQECDSSLVNVVWGLCQGQPFLTNYFNQRFG